MKSDSNLVHEVLEEYSGLTKSWMHRYLPRAEPQRYLYDLTSEYPLRSGRGLRPTICLANAKIFGAGEQAAVLSAVSIELLHNAMLIHDDIEDESELRRGKPTLNSAHGVPLAINAGDMLLVLALRPLLDSANLLGPQISQRLIHETFNMAQQAAEGQALDLGWRRDNSVDITPNQYFDMVGKKTSSLTTIHPLRVGALLGAGPQAPLRSLSRFGYFLGSAFQIQDDLLNLTGDPKAYGKELAGDIGEGKRTLMLIRLFELASDRDRRKLRKLFCLNRDERLEHCEWIAEKMCHFNCLEYARAVAHAHAGAALKEYNSIYASLPETREKQFVQQLAHWVIERS